MASSDNEELSIVDKFNRDNFSLWKFKMEMLFASGDLWNIVDKTEQAPPSNANVNAKKAFEKQSKTKF